MCDDRAVRRRLAASSLVCAVVGLAGCRASIPTRVPVPRDGLGVGATTTLAAGPQTGVYVVENDVGTPYALALGGVTAGAPVARGDDASLELDVGVGGGTETAAANATVGVGGTIGARAWWHAWEPVALGAELATSIAADVVDPRGAALESVWLQPEARALAAWRVVDGVWLATRPGVVVQPRAWPQPTSNVVWTMIDAPLAVAYAAPHLRVGVEAGVAATLVPFPIPSARVGVQLEWTP